MLWMGDTVKDIDRLIVTVISTRGSIPISNRLALLAAAHNTTLLLPLASDLACYYKLAWTGLDWTTNRHEGRRSQVGTYKYCFSVLKNGRLSFKKSVAAPATSIGFLLDLELHSDPKGWKMNMKNEHEPPFSKWIHVGTHGRWVEWINKNQRMDGDEKTNLKLTGKPTQRTPAKEGKRQASEQAAGQDWERNYNTEYRVSDRVRKIENTTKPLASITTTTDSTRLDSLTQSCNHHPTIRNPAFCID